MKIKVIFFFIVAQLYEFYFRFLSLDKTSVVFTSTNNANFNFNSRFLFKFFIEQLAKDHNFHFKKIYFVINNEKLKQQLNWELGNYFISTHSFSGILKSARSGLWISSCLETPYVTLPILKNKKRVVFHLGHGVPLKNIILAEKNITHTKLLNRYIRSRIFTHVNSYSPSFQPVLERAFRNKSIIYTHLGQPRNDSFQKNKQRESKKAIFSSLSLEINEESRIILYAPTWRPYGKTVFFPFNDLNASELNSFLAERNTFIFLRTHPFYPSTMNSSFYNQSNIIFFDNKLFPEIMDYLYLFDGLITDYSSIYFDFLCIDKPIGFIPYDFEKYKKDVGFSVPYDQITPGPQIFTTSDFYQFISFHSDTFKLERNNISSITNSKPIKNNEETLKYILDICK